MAVVHTQAEVSNTDYIKENGLFNKATSYCEEKSKLGSHQSKSKIPSTIYHPSYIPSHYKSKEKLGTTPCELLND